MKLIDVCELIVDCPHSTAKDEGQGIPLVRTPNIGKGRLELSGVHRVSEDIYNQRIERAVPQAGDLILAREAPVGNVALIMPGQKVCLGQRVVLIRPDKEKADAAYLTYYLLSEEVQYRLKNNANGAVVAHLNMNEIRNLAIDLPELSIQKRIASILSSLDDKISINNHINHNLEEQAQALYKSWFEDNSECENWPKTSLSAFFNVITGKKDANFSSPDGPYPFFTCSQAPLRAQSYSFEGKAILMAGNGDFNVKRYIGKFEAYQRTYVLIPFEDKYQSFLYLLMSLHLGDITGGSRGSVIKFITKGNIADYSFRFPPYCIDDKLAVLNSIYAQVDEHNAEIEHLSRLRDQLLPKLISGDYCC